MRQLIILYTRGHLKVHSHYHSTDGRFTYTTVELEANFQSLALCYNKSTCVILSCTVNFKCVMVYSTTQFLTRKLKILKLISDVKFYTRVLISSAELCTEVDLAVHDIQNARRLNSVQQLILLYSAFKMLSLE